MQKNSEKPAEEMRRLIRIVAGTRSAGETDQQLRGRAARRLGISASRAKVFWFGETNNIRADEMDLARELVFVQPIEEAIHVLEAAEARLEATAQRVLEGLHRRLAARHSAAAALGLHRPVGVPQRRPAVPQGRDHSDPSSAAVSLTSRTAG